MPDAPTRTEAISIARRHFNEQDHEWNVLAALAHDGEITPYTATALADFHASEHPPGRCSAYIGVPCDLRRLAAYVGTGVRT